MPRLSRKFSWEDDYEEETSYADAQFAEALRTMNDREENVSVDIGLEDDYSERQPRNLKGPSRRPKFDRV